MATIKATCPMCGDVDLTPRQVRVRVVEAIHNQNLTPDEFAILTKISSSKGVSLGPRILRADTAIITLAAITLMAWGDWDKPARSFGAKN